jgi:hypothetical protein
MTAPSHSQAHANGANAVSAGYLALLPRIRELAQLAFRHVRCPQTRDEAIAETIALSWAWYRRLAEKGNVARAFPSVLAGLAARAVRSGRRLCGQERARDALSFVAQRRHGFGVGPLPEHSTLEGNAWDEALIDNAQSPVPDQAAFRIDFPRWRKTRSERDRRLMDDLMLGDRTFDVGQKYQLTSGRVSQLRRDFFLDWERFCGHPVAPEDASVAS